MTKAKRVPTWFHGDQEMWDQLALPAFLKRDKATNVAPFFKSSGVTMLAEAAAPPQIVKPVWWSSMYPDHWLNDPEQMQALTRVHEAKEIKKAERLEVLAAKREPREPKRPSREGLIPVATIAAEFKIIPREARGFLRAAKYPKPDVGWAFTEQQAADVRRVIKEQMQCEATSKQPAPRSPKSNKSSSGATTSTSPHRASARAPRSQPQSKKRTAKRKGK